ncbi:hypothetical protein VTP01DRAFT_9786 [Rhizomucor pusillus]|uniref:uncharacterized protein n=1 Tax=Rhizomucor pusillus TaxID=4840 RepID=UPI00374399DA
MTQAPDNKASSNHSKSDQQKMNSSKRKGKKNIDPEYVKSPPPSGSRPASRAASLKSSLGSKSSGFLSLLLCCTAGAGSLLDNGDKPSSIIKQRRQSNKEMPKIITNPTELKNLAEQDPAAAAAAVAPETPHTPASIPQSPQQNIVRLLPPVSSEHQGRKCLVLDLDETLVHSSFKIIPHPDFIVPVEIDNQYHNVYVLKRPGVDEFMRKMGEKYEIVVFTASLSKYADPVLDMLDVHKVIKHRLFREACFNHKGNYVKDLSQLGRDLSATLILDNSPTSYIFHNANAVPVSTWFNDPHDTELTDLVAFLEDLTQVDDVTLVLDNTIDLPSKQQ